MRWTRRTVNTCRSFGLEIRNFVNDTWPSNEWLKCSWDQRDSESQMTYIAVLRSHLVGRSDADNIAGPLRQIEIQTIISVHTLCNRNNKAVWLLSTFLRIAFCSSECQCDLQIIIVRPHYLKWKQPNQSAHACVTAIISSVVHVAIWLAHPVRCISRDLVHGAFFESGTPTLIGLPSSWYGLVSAHSRSCLPIVPLYRLSAGGQWDNAVSLWSCAMHLINAWQDRITSRSVYWSWFIWHGLTSHSQWESSVRFKCNAN